MSKRANITVIKADWNWNHLEGKIMNVILTVSTVCKKRIRMCNHQQTCVCVFAAF